MPTPTRPSVPANDERVGPYLLRERIGRGGMADVWLGIDPRRCGVHRLVAIKRLLPHLANDEDYVEMFLDEATIGSRVNHTNVCRVIDHGIDDAHQPYLVMEHLCGEPLNGIAKRLTKRPPALPGVASPALGGSQRSAVVARVIADACAGLHAFHEIRTADGATLDTVHRDVSPDNVFVTCDGTTKLIDFGVAKANVRRHRTETGLLKGKLAYLAPETLAGAEVDRRADIWALGVIAWELLCGRRLFRRSTDGKTLKALTKDAIVHPSEICKEVPQALGDAVMGALQRRRSDRYDDAAELGAALLGAVAPLASDTTTVRRFLRDTFEHDESCHVRRLDEHDIQAVTVSIQTPLPSASTVEGDDEPPRSDDDVSLAVTPAPSVPPAPIRMRRTALLGAAAMAAVVSALALVPSAMQRVDHARSAAVAGAGWRAVATTIPAQAPAGSLRVEVWDADRGEKLLQALLPPEAAERLGEARAAANAAAQTPVEPDERPLEMSTPTAKRSPVPASMLSSTPPDTPPEASSVPKVGEVAW